MPVRGQCPTPMQRQHASMLQKRYWCEVRAVVQCLREQARPRHKRDTLTVGLIRTYRRAPLLNHYWDLLVHGPQDSKQRTLVAALADILYHTMTDAAHGTVFNLNAVATRLGYSIVSNSIVSHAKPTPDPIAATGPGVVSPPENVREPYSAEPTTTPPALNAFTYDEAGSQLGMALWFIRKVGDVRRAKELLDVAAAAMDTALGKPR